MSQSQWTLFVFTLGCLLVIYLYLYLSTDFRHIIISTDTGNEPNDYILINKMLQDEDNPRIQWEEVMRGSLTQNDTRLMKFIQKHYLTPQPPSSVNYNLTNLDLNYDPSMGQTTLVLHALKNMKNGFFVECGAWDGETRSNTLLLERLYGWKGLLIEADPRNYAKLLEKGRRVWSANVCLAIKPFPHQVTFKQQENTGRISEKPGPDPPGPGFVKIQCLPLFSILSALNQTQIDYLSLDVEGSELEVLKTIPFKSLFIKVLSVEYIHDIGGREAVRRYMTTKGFSVYGEVTDPAHSFANDWIFINNNILY